MRAILRRMMDTPWGVFGVLDLFTDQGVRVARFVTGEDDWLQNLPGASAIPAGTYVCRRGIFPKAGETFEITGVPGRSAILFHAGNTEENVAGCVLLGADFGPFQVADEDEPTHPRVFKLGVVESRKSLDAFRRHLAGVQEFSLLVEWAVPGSWRLPPEPVSPTPSPRMS